MFEREDAYNSLDRIQQLISSCDRKTSIMLGAYGVIVANLFSDGNLSKIKEIVSEAMTQFGLGDCFYLIALMGSTIAVIVGVCYLVAVLIPNLESGDSDSIIFFGTIAENENSKKFEAKVKLKKDADILTDIIEQIHISAKICNDKFLKYKKGATYSIYGAISLIITLLIGGFIY